MSTYEHEISQRLRDNFGNRCNHLINQEAKEQKLQLRNQASYNEFNISFARN